MMDDNLFANKAHFYHFITILTLLLVGSETGGNEYFLTLPFSMSDRMEAQPGSP